RRRAWRRVATAVWDSHAHDEHSHTHEHEHDHDHEHHSHHSHDQGHTHDHDHDHTHDHEDPAVPHKHGPFGREHTHLLSDGQEVTMGTLLALGFTGGIIPCPSAVTVLLAAAGSRHEDLGIVLILAFSVGLAAVLTGIGLLV